MLHLKTRIQNLSHQPHPAQVTSASLLYLSTDLMTWFVELVCQWWFDSVRGIFHCLSHKALHWKGGWVDKYGSEELRWVIDTASTPVLQHRS